jgi:phosphatidylserine/phosphatidylglycerophosphate/cardiolipin synthase-like enzyme
VIVYTGRNLTRDEEAALLKYSRSIIIKGAKSPERLIDEVTLFLHQNEASLPEPQRKVLEQVRRMEPLLAGKKVLVVDDDWATVGSSNLDPLSLVLNLEANLIVRDRAFVQTLSNNLTQDFSLSRQVSPQDQGDSSRWRRRVGRAIVSWLAKTYLRLAGATGRY